MDNWESTISACNNDIILYMNDDEIFVLGKNSANISLTFDLLDTPRWELSVEWNDMAE